MHFTDECFAHGILGTINITEAWKLVWKHARPQKYALTPDFLQMMGGTDIDMAQVLTMDLKRAKEPFCSYLTIIIEYT